MAQKTLTPAEHAAKRAADQKRALALYATGKPLGEIAKSLGFEPGTGNNYTRLLLQTAGAWKATETKIHSTLERAKNHFKASATVFKAVR
jgi:hypothetical protein